MKDGGSGEGEVDEAKCIYLYRPTKVISKNRVYGLIKCCYKKYKRKNEIWQELMTISVTNDKEANQSKLLLVRLAVCSSKAINNDGVRVAGGGLVLALQSGP